LLKETLTFCRILKTIVLPKLSIFWFKRYYSFWTRIRTLYLSVRWHFRSAKWRRTATE